MRNWRLLLIAITLLLAPAVRAEGPFPFPEEEALHYTIGWPSGLSVGEATFTAAASKSADGEIEGWQFQFDLDAAIPGFKIEDHYTSLANAGLCSLEFEKKLNHGKRKAWESTVFDQDAKKATRKTLTEGGGESQIDIPECGMDGITFLYHLRDELSRGRLPNPQKVLFGALYEVRFQLIGEKSIQIGEQTFETDQMTVTVKGPASESTFILAVARDDARTPVQITVPLEPGNFTMELQPAE